MTVDLEQFLHIESNPKYLYQFRYQLILYCLKIALCICRIFALDFDNNIGFIVVKEWQNLFNGFDFIIIFLSFDKVLKLNLNKIIWFLLTKLHANFV